MAALESFTWYETNSVDSVDLKTTHKATMQPYAVKVIELEGLKEHQFLLLINECRVLRIAQHKNLMDIFDIYMKENTVYVCYHSIYRSNFVRWF